MRIHYLTGSRADFGLIKETLLFVDSSPNHEIGLLITGQHLLPQYGNTISDIYASGLDVLHQIPVYLDGDSPLSMGMALSSQISQLLKYWSHDRPDMVLLLGDRGEMLAGAIAAVHLGIHIGHLHGGERSGTLDESFRHAISKLSHYHFVATSESSSRLSEMGEDPDKIFTIGAPGLVGISPYIRKNSSTDSLLSFYGFNEGRLSALLLFHPVVQERSQSVQQIHSIITALLKHNFSILVLKPNSDAGGKSIENYLSSLTDNPQITLLTHLARSEYCRLLSEVDLLVGNSSSGIIESASFGVPCLNVGSRQNMRQRNLNTVDCLTYDIDSLYDAISRSLSLNFPPLNCYGDGNAHRNLLSVLDSLTLSQDALSKCNSY